MKTKKINGFTLVELLAVIVILAIIMIIAIPSVLSTLTTAKSKSFNEYVDKVYLKAEEKTVSDILEDTSSKCTIYNINEMFDDTGDFEGYVMVIKQGNDTKYYITMWNSEYMISAYEYDGKLDDSKREKFTNSNDEKITKEYLVSQAGGVSCTDTANKPIYYTGTKDVESSNGFWTAHYTKGVMDDCYMTKTSTTTKSNLGTAPNGRKIYSPFVITGGEKYYCTTVRSTDKNECVKSLDCCTGTKAPATGGSEYFIYYNYYPESETCGYLLTEYEDGTVGGWLSLMFDGAGLPATNYTGN